MESLERSTSREGASAVGRKEVGRFAIHDEGEEDGRVEKVAFWAGSWRMRIHPSVETEAAMLVHSKRSGLAREDG